MTTGEGDAAGRLFPEDLDGVDPVAAVMLADACRSIAAYPEPVGVGALFTAAERVPGGWQVVCACDPLPQGARELLADHLDDRAAFAGGERGAALRAAARDLCAGPPRDEVRAGGLRFRVVRIEQLVRNGPDGPEPPRPTDLDLDPGREHPRGPSDRAHDFLPDGWATPDIATAELLWQLLDAAARAGTRPPEPFLTPLPLAPAFTVAERTGGRWRPVGRLHDAPRQAREALAVYFRHIVPAVERPDAGHLAEYAEAAELMADGTRRNGITVAGRRFRIVRIERLALMGSDGPRC
ncbi:DUF5954 family protein [Actinomadura sp. NPDC047616]|uniref:DUF5954 family protein n=1 Tax=Actinomadura sp. NPDC047616 TaxID=3155914 RepID=UPI0033C949C6